MQQLQAARGALQNVQSVQGSFASGVRGSLSDDSRAHSLAHVAAVALRVPVLHLRAARHTHTHAKTPEMTYTASSANASNHRRERQTTSTRDESAAHSRVSFLTKYLEAVSSTRFEYDLESSHTLESQSAPRLRHTLQTPNVESSKSSSLISSRRLGEKRGEEASRRRLSLCQITARLSHTMGKKKKETLAWCGVRWCATTCGRALRPRLNPSNERRSWIRCGFLSLVFEHMVSRSRSHTQSPTLGHDDRECAGERRTSPTPRACFCQRAQEKRSTSDTAHLPLSQNSTKESTSRTLSWHAGAVRISHETALIPRAAPPVFSGRTSCSCRPRSFLPLSKHSLNVGGSRLSTRGRFGLGGVF